MNRRKYNQEETQQEKMEKLEKLVPKGKKKWVRYDEGALLYSMGLHSFHPLKAKCRLHALPWAIPLLTSTMFRSFSSSS